MRKYTCKQCGLGPMNMAKLRKHKEDAHGVIMGTGRLKSNTHAHTQTHDHDESVPHTHDFGERVEYLQEGAKSLLAEMKAKHALLHKEASELGNKIEELAQMFPNLSKP